ncbi:MAG: aldolase catalytic domain-containing protein [Planctomycetota bacterium]|jgi:4-hydroxy 2-oxovalerate aldolase|nr:aldolase catalytic domain-containing protein [Planctomycetota bacterium]MDP7248673.1 aldolase catalytic domain-containing protein [Planctomycetota bacterium]
MSENSKSSGWVGYRPEVKILDCTVRDGGLINDHHFEDSFVRGVYDACVAAGVHYMEIGYKGSKKLFPREEFGDWKFSDEDDIRRVIGENDSDMKISVMADAEKTDYKEDILPASESVVDMVRVATYIHQIPIALDMVKDAHDKGYETTVNIMAASTVHEREMSGALDALANSEVGTVYVVDSFGSLYSEQIRDQTKFFLDKLKPAGKEVGIHAHNNQQLAYANTIESLIAGSNLIDATINGMGRGAGNCSLELLIGFLHNPAFRLRPILKCIQQHCLPLLSKMEWGYQVPYLVTGLLNQHPRSAIKMRGGEERDDYVKFYDEMIDEEA